MTERTRVFTRKRYIHSLYAIILLRSKVCIIYISKEKDMFHSSLRKRLSSSSVEPDHPGGVFFCLVSSSSTG